MKDRAEVFTTYANLIGYSRVAFALLAFYVAETHPILFIFSYGLSAILDGFDGWAARKYNQCTELGVVLDMITDRFSGALIMATLSTLYPQHRFGFQFCIALDFCSHWLQMYSTLKGGEKHHKKAASSWWILRIYYGSTPVLFTMVLGSESFYVLYYAWHFKNQILPGFLHIYLEVLLIVSCIIFVIKMIINVVQLISASEKLADLDIKKQE